MSEALRHASIHVVQGIHEGLVSGLLLVAEYVFLTQVFNCDDCVTHDSIATGQIISAKVRSVFLK